MSKINWFPGHMKKTLESLQAILKLIDIVIVLVDARAPLSTTNPTLDRIVANKPKIYLLNKADLADKKTTQAWIAYFEKQNFSALAIKATTFKTQDLISKINQVMADKVKKQAAKGLINRPIRAAIIGIPNVGKSTLINTMAKKKAMHVENRAGVTKALKWIKLANNLELLDTPGILWPKFEDDEIALKIAMLGGIKESILPGDSLSISIIKYLSLNHITKLNTFFDLRFEPCIDDATAQKAIEMIAKKRGLILKANKINQAAVESLIIREFQNGSFGPLSLEQPY